MRILKPDSRSVKTILLAMRHLEHATANQIHTWIVENRPEETLGLTTVYRNLKKLISWSMVRPLTFFEGEILYEVADLHHQHLICTACRKVEARRAEPMGWEFLEESGFEVLYYNFDVFGLCAQCKVKVDCFQESKQPSGVC